MGPQVVAPGGSRSGCFQSPAACLLFCEPPAGAHIILQVFSWSSIRGGLSESSHPQISSTPEAVRFSQVCSPFFLEKGVLHSLRIGFVLSALRDSG